jgi:3-methyladenine DNA glycosylase/8-oxoguanine DNA glycosylase
MAAARRRGAGSWKGARILTIGHSTRTFDELVALLRTFGVTLLADIRTVPRSRRNPQFNRDSLPSALRSRRLRYAHLPELGGLRRSSADSPNKAWRNLSFRGYADHMLSAEFEAGLEKLRLLAGQHRVALMCAEAVPWRCHRSLVADALTVRGAKVEHITSATRANPHRLTPFAVVEGSHVTYPGDESTALSTLAPFHLQATVRVLQRRPTNSVNIWEKPGRYARAIVTDDGVALLRVENRATIDAPDLHLTVSCAKPTAAVHAELVQTVRRILGLDVDPAPLQQLLEAERGLARVARALRGMRPPRFAGLFEAFANVIPFQQVSLDAGSATVTRLVERFGDVLEQDGSSVRVFPEARIVAEAPVGTLRACGLSLRKAEALRGIATAIASGDLSEQKLSTMSSLEAIRWLRELPGIGPWSANLVLLRGLGRLDVFPPGDVGFARGFERISGMSGKTTLERMIRRFGDQRGYLYFCSLGSALLEKGLISSAPD